MLATARGWVIGFELDWPMVSRRVVVTVASMAVTALLWPLLHFLRKRPSWVQWSSVMLAALPAALLLAWAALYLALLYGEQARAAERREGEYRRAAKAAELRSLRYQINPHFLFNTLNSLSALVVTGRAERAERMIQTLSNFYRANLSEDPTLDHSLAEEVEQQKRYLEIEAVRFSERLKSVFAIPQALAAAQVPGMILQPLIENSVERAVARRTPRARKSREWLNEFWVPHRSELLRIAATDVERIDAERDYVRLHVGQMDGARRSFLLLHTVSGLEARLDPAKFIRLHRSVILRRDRIAGLRHDGMGVWSAELDDGSAVRIGRTYLARAKAMTGR